MAKYPQAEQAFEYTRNSYADAGGMPAVLKAIQLGAVKAIAELVDRPDDEKRRDYGGILPHLQQGHDRL